MSEVEAVEGRGGGGIVYGGAKPEPPWEMFQERVERGKPGREGSVRIPESRLKRRSHSAFSAQVVFQGSSLRRGVRWKKKGERRGGGGWGGGGGGGRTLHR